MKEPLIKLIDRPVEPVCYGFAEDELPADVDDGYWTTQVQHPFRGEYLWLFGHATAELTSLELGRGPKAEQLVGGSIPFIMMHRGLSLADFLTLVQHEGHQRKQLNAAPVHAALWKACGAPSVALPAVSTGTSITFKYCGRVQGIVLIGSQVK